MNTEELFYVMALTRLTNFNYQQALELYKTVGSAQLLFEHRNEIGDIVKDASPHLMAALKDWSDAMKRAEYELHYMQEHSIRGLTLADDDYPQRLCECPDAPLVLYYIGNSDLNQMKIVSIVGTRHITTYGQDLVRRFVSDLKRHCHNVLVISGLAYGVDINAHREALANGYETIGVLAHGLDQIYPYHHRETAAKMVAHGGLLTEFMTQTNADKPNFVRRNRIVAGMADATILIESGVKGGGLITADIAQSYARSVFAFPGNVGQEFSEGCNNLIRDNGAGLISNAEDFVKAMGWPTMKDMPLWLTPSLCSAGGAQITDLTPEEEKIISLLKETNDLQLNIITVKTGIPIGRLTALLFELEMKGVVKPLAGGMYHLLL